MADTNIEIKKIQLSRGSKAALNAATSIIPKKGEIIIDTDTNLFRVGDGVTALSELKEATLSVQPDWSQTDETKPDCILNKPNVAEKEDKENKVEETIDSSNTDKNHFPSTLALINILAGKVDSSKVTYQTVAPTASISDGGIHIVYLVSEPTTKYEGYIYLIKE